MRSEPTRVGGISLAFAKKFSYKHVQVGQPGKVG